MPVAHAPTVLAAFIDANIQTAVGTEMAANRRRRFKLQELADEFGVSGRAIRDPQELADGFSVSRRAIRDLQELADEFGVSRRTIRDPQELSELGVPLYSEVGPHGGYQIPRERVPPPIAFTEGEAAAMLFIGLGEDAALHEPEELRAAIRTKLAELRERCR